MTKTPAKPAQSASETFWPRFWNLKRDGALWSICLDLIILFHIFHIPSSQSKVDRLTCGRFIQESTQVKHFKHGIHRFMWIFDRFTWAANFLENSHFLFAALLSPPLTPLHVKCFPIEISGGLSNFLHRSPISRFYCTAPLQRNTTWETFLNGIKSHSHKSRWSPLRSYRGAWFIQICAYLQFHIEGTLWLFVCE